ncbi:cytochrome P450 [Trichoderma chlorosporum]
MSFTIQLLTGAFIALPVATLLFSICYYVIDIHRLRRFPSPSLAATLSPFWMMWHIIRIGPKTLSFSAPEAYKDIYGHDNLAKGNPSMSDATDRQLHSIKRKNLSMTSSVEELLTAIRTKLSGRALSKNDKHVLNIFSYDVISKMLWSSSYGFLKCGNDDCRAMSIDGRSITVPAIRCFQASVRFNALFAHLPPTLYQISRFVTKPMYQTAAADHFSGMVRYGIVKRMERGDSDDIDFFSFFPTQKTKKCPNPMKLPELIAECGTFLNADTQQKLYSLLTQTLPKESQPIASYTDQSKIPFLTAVLDETFRLLPPVRFNLPRRIVQNGAVVAGHYIPAGVTVSSSVYIMHRNKSLFREPLKWLPERWLSENPDFSQTERRNLKDFVLPFTLGGRACIGRNLAYMELSICIAALVMAFEWGVSVDDKAKYNHQESINYTACGLRVTVRPRSYSYQRRVHGIL